MCCRVREALTPVLSRQREPAPPSSLPRTSWRSKAAPGFHPLQPQIPLILTQDGCPCSYRRRWGRTFRSPSMNLCTGHHNRADPGLPPSWRGVLILEEMQPPRCCLCIHGNRIPLTKRRALPVCSTTCLAQHIHYQVPWASFKCCEGSGFPHSSSRKPCRCQQPILREETVENGEGSENPGSLQPATVAGMLAEGPGPLHPRQRASSHGTANSVRGHALVSSSYPQVR